MKTSTVKRWFNWWMYGQSFFHSAMVAKSPRSLDELLTLWLAVAERNGIRTVVHGAFRTVIEMMLRTKSLSCETVDGRCIVHHTGLLKADDWMAAEIKACDSNTALTGGLTAKKG